METSELLRKVRKIEIKTRGLSANIFSGQYHSVFKGRGIAFSEVREYQIGDDVRLIDWNVTARFNHPYVKVFEEERELTLILLVDISNSQLFGSGVSTKKDLVAEISAVLAFSALQNNDKVGAILFTSDIERFIPPKKGRTHILRIIRDILDYQPLNLRTNIYRALEFLSRSIKKRAIVFIISDFFDDGFEQALKILSKKHDTIALRIIDQREYSIPKVGLLLTQDLETGEYLWLDSSNDSVRDRFRNYYLSREKSLETLFNKYKIDSVKIETDKPYISALNEFFQIRSRRFRW
ncbi:MAG: DUF58 domain-containing protein [Candidatus Kapaibacteriales bacterium]